MFKMTRTDTPDGVQYVVEHFADPLLQPTPTAHTFTSLPLAWVDALGRAGKQSLINNRPEEMWDIDGRKFRVTVERITDDGLTSDSYRPDGSRAFRFD